MAAKNHSLDACEISELTPGEAVYDYLLYGLRIRSRIRLTLDECFESGTADVEFLPGDPDRFADIVAQVTFSSDWIHLHEVADGWSYIGYDGMFEFLVSPSGDRILYRFLAEVTLESFQTYALGRVFSFALVKMGYEPLHAATVVVNGRAVAFLGASTYGKSSLAACFVAAGYPLLTDDVLRLEEHDGRYMAFPGPSKLKLLPAVARHYLGDISVGVPINNKATSAPKLVFQLSREQRFTAAAPLAAIYVVAAPRKVYRKQRIMISALPALESVVSILSFTHNHNLTGPARLTRQLDAAQRLITMVPMRSLAYPRSFSILGDVKNAILSDLNQYGDQL
jgi:hypothetical protein